MALEPAPVPTPVLWLSRVMGWLCILGVVMQVGVFILMLAAPGLIESPPPCSGGGACISSHTDDADVIRDPVFLVAHAVAIGVFGWAMINARTSFLGIGKGDYFAHRTIAGLRNLAIGVLAYSALSPLARWLATTVHALSQKHGEISLSLGISSAGLITVVFTGAVILITAVMAHAAKVAEENQSFV